MKISVACSVVALLGTITFVDGIIERWIQPKIWRGCLFWAWYFVEWQVLARVVRFLLWCWVALRLWWAASGWEESLPWVTGVWPSWEERQDWKLGYARWRYRMKYPAEREAFLWCLALVVVLPVRGVLVWVVERAKGVDGGIDRAMVWVDARLVAARDHVWPRPAAPRRSREWYRSGASEYTSGVPLPGGLRRRAGHSSTED